MRAESFPNMIHLNSCGVIILVKTYTLRKKKRCLNNRNLTTKLIICPSMIQNKALSWSISLKVETKPIIPNGSQVPRYLTQHMLGNVLECVIFACLKSSIPGCDFWIMLGNFHGKRWGSVETFSRRLRSMRRNFYFPTCTIW